jgi:hypothetical protein
VRYDDFKAQREAELQLHLTQTNKRILEDVMSVTRFIGEKESFHLILNANKANPAASDVLFSKHVDDLIERVVASLNAAKPKANDAPPAATDGKPK